MLKVCCFILLPLACWSQASPGPAAHANSSGPCSIANTGSDNKLQITCGIGKKQGDQILAILNRILADQLDTNAVMAKLDEILHQVNPNAATKVYFCGGGWRSQGPGPNTGVQIVLGAGNDPSFQQMVDLYNKKPIDGPAMLKVCSAQIAEKPEWLTPRLFCAVAYLMMGDKTKGKEMVDFYDHWKGPAYDDDQSCQQLSGAVHAASNVTSP